VGGIWKHLELQARENLECCKQSLVGDSGGNSEDENADRKHCAHEVSDRNKDSIGNRN
jgi:hypothetical protein